jgi:hypothetical protein
MSATDYQSDHHAITYTRPSTIESLAAEQLAHANTDLGPIDLSYDVAMDELPD